jgi:trk system potassium uptake protein TrkA
MKNFVVIGVGTFGYYLTRRLAEMGHEVLAMDVREDQVKRVAEFASKAVLADSTDRGALEALGVADCDAVVVSLGGNIGASVLTTLNVKEMGVRRIIARAVTDPHGRALQRLGADEVVLPRRDMAERIAQRLVNVDVLEFVPLGSDHSILESAPSKEMLGKSLAELDFRRRYGVNVILVRQVVPDSILVAPGADFVVKDSDILVLLGRNEDLDAFRNR